MSTTSLLLAELVEVADGLHLDEVDDAANSHSAPIGSWIGTAFAARRSFIVWTEFSKLAPMRSILLMNAMRGT